MKDLQNEEEIMKISVCVGSSCHLKGSYDVIEAFKACIAEHECEDKITLAASFCLGHCQTGVSVKVDDEYLGNVTPDNAKEIFETQLLPKA